MVYWPTPVIYGVVSIVVNIEVVSIEREREREPRSAREVDTPEASMLYRLYSCAGIALYNICHSISRQRIVCQ